MRKGPRGEKVWKILGKVLGSAAFLAALVLLYVTIVVAQPQPSGEEPVPPQSPLAGNAPSVEIKEEAELREMAAGFPAPVMSFMSGSGMTFVSGSRQDVPYREGWGRVLTLYWQTWDGEPLILRSIYPAEGLEIMGRGDYHFSGQAGPVLFGQSSVRMENGETVRVHVQAAGRGLYVLIVPFALRDSLSDIARSIQLFTAE